MSPRVTGSVPSTRAQYFLSIPVSSVSADQLRLQEDHSDEVDPLNKPGYILLGNIPNKIRAKPGVLRNVLLTFFLAGKRCTIIH